MAELTNKQQLFVSAYCGVALFNGTQAARLAGYGKPTTKDTTLAVIASENLRKPNVRRAIDAILEDRMMSDEEAALIHAEQARGTMARFVRRGTGGRLVLDTTTEEAAQHLHLVKKFKQKERILKSAGEDDEEIRLVEIETEVELYNAQTAAKMIRDGHGAYNHTQSVEHSGPEGGPIPLQWDDA